MSLNGRIVRVDTNTSQLLDHHGRTRLFRGVNVVYKRPPWHPPTAEFDAITSFADEDARLLASLNLNCIRLGVHWAGVEPERGQYSPSYIEAIRKIVQICARHGIYVLLEFHQDVLARQFLGHGVPDWFVNQSWFDTWWRRWMRFPVPNRLRPARTDKTGMPLEEDSRGLTWYLLYFTFAVADAFGKLYANHDGLLDSFASYWRHVVEQFKDEPNILGYEIMNEPWPGNHWKTPLLLLPGYASGTTLHTMHTVVAAAIRQADPDALIYFEGATWDITSHAPHVPGGPAYADRTVHSYHYYQPPQRSTLDTYLGNRIKDAKRFGGCGLFMTEWEMWYGDGSEARAEKLFETVEAADRHLQNWAGWAYKSFAQGANSTDGSIFDDTTGKKRRVYELLWSRAYAKAVAGQIVAMSFERESGKFSLSYDLDPEVSEPTEIGLVQEIWYPKGVHVEIEPSETCSWTMPDPNRILIRAGALASRGTRIHVKVTPR
ncbi:glycoside hydrolase superfamily [Phlyctochytrium arcticum]|nr:glycoside hydrolase superfamily [Phlyctochytrium arcticum]